SVRSYARARTATTPYMQIRRITDLLDGARFVLGKFQVDLYPTHIAAVVEAAVTTARPDAAERGVRLSAEIERGDDLVAADAGRLQQVIGNILSNAIKFTPAGRQVDLRLWHADEKLQISVSDQGEGSEPSFLPHVYERLSQAAAGTRRALGLG